MAIEKPNYTQIPNALLGDLLPGEVVSPGLMSDMNGSELKVFIAICRLTFGYHRAERRASLTMIEIFTGMSRQSVITAAKNLESDQLIERSQDGGITLWRVKVTSDQPNPVKKLDQNQSKNLTSGSQKIRPDQSKNLTSDSLKIRPPSKKENRKKPERKKNSVGVGVDKKDFAELVQTYQTEFGKVTPNLSLILADDLQTFGLDWIRQAIDVAVMNDKRVWSYVRGILKRWKEQGGPQAGGADDPLPFTDELPEAEPKTEWDQAKAELKQQMTQATYDAQISQTKMIRENGHYLILAPTAYNAEMLEKRLAPVIIRTLMRVTGEAAPVVRFGVAS